MLNKLRTLFNNMYWEDKVKKVVHVTVERYTDGQKVIPIDVLHLECGHKYWQHKGEGSLIVRLCDACILAYLQTHLGDKKGMVWFGRWERYLKVKN